MPAEIPTSEPTCLTAGDTWAWTNSLGDYPASDGWELSYALRGPMDLDIDWGSEVSADGDDFAVEVAAASTGTLAAGRYSLYGFVTKSGARHTVYRETLLVLADPADAVGALSTAEAFLDQVNAAITAHLTGDPKTAKLAVELQVQGDLRRYETLEDLYDLRSRLHEEIAALRRDNPLSFAPVSFVAW